MGIMNETIQKAESDMDRATKDHLYNQLVKLGDMMGDGLHHEPDGKWIAQEYKKVCKALGITTSKPRNTTAINERMSKRVQDVSCGKCYGTLKQTRSGSKRASCSSCGAKWQLLK